MTDDEQRVLNAALVNGLAGWTLAQALLEMLVASGTIHPEDADKMRAHAKKHAELVSQKIVKNEL